MIAEFCNDEFLPPHLQELAVRLIHRAVALTLAFGEGEKAEQQRQVKGYQSECREVEQALGKVLGYPWYRDDQKNFPGSSEVDGVCVGEHVPSSIANEAATKIATQAARIEMLEETVRFAEQKFREYGDLHAAKPDMVKAQRNYDLADQLRNALGERK